MKISPISNNNNLIHKKDKQFKEQDGSSSISFCGLADAMVSFWQMVDNGGRAMQFTVEDMTGTNFPRLIKGALNGYEYTHKINWNAVKQEGIREFLTGPTMCLSPFVMLLIAKKVQGKSSNIKIENIRNLTHLLNEASEGGKKHISADDFYKYVVNDMLTTMVGKENFSDDVIDSFVSQMKKLDTATDKHEAESILSSLEQLFQKTLKNKMSSYDNTTFKNAQYSVTAGKLKGNAKFKNYMEYATSYIHDFAKQNSDGKLLKTSEESISKFKNKLLGKRLGLIGLMVVGTGFIMKFIPKLYTKASGNVNPTAAVIYKVAKEQEKDGAHQKESEAK